MYTTPSPSDNNGRDRKGRFAEGNRASRGNPLSVHLAKLRSALVKAVTPDDMQAVVAALIVKAKAGDVLAARELLDPTVGKAPAAISLDGFVDVSQVDHAATAALRQSLLQEPDYLNYLRSQALAADAEGKPDDA